MLVQLKPHSQLTGLNLVLPLTLVVQQHLTLMDFSQELVLEMVDMLPLAERTSSSLEVTDLELLILLTFSLLIQVQHLRQMPHFLQQA